MTEEKAGEGAVAHLNDQSIRDYPVLEKVLLKKECVTCGGMSDAPRTGLAGRENIGRASRPSTTDKRSAQNMHIFECI